MSRHVFFAFYVLDHGLYVPYIVGAPDYVNRSFHEFFAGGVPPITPLIAGSNGPPSAGPIVAGLADDELVTLRGSSCLLGEIAPGFSLSIFEGGSLDELETCARSQRVTALYVLHDGDWVSFILGAPDSVNQSFFELYADGLPPVTPLVARSDSPLTASGKSGDAAEKQVARRLGAARCSTWS